MKTILSIITVFLTMSIFGQIGLGGLKSKVKSKAKSEVKSTENKTQEKVDPKSSSNDSQSLNKSDEEKEKIAISKSPASSVIWDYRIAMDSFDEAPGTKKGSDQLKKAEEKLAAIKQQDPDFSYIPQYEQRIKDGKLKQESSAQSEDSKKDLSRELERMANNALFFKDELSLNNLKRSKFDSLESVYATMKEEGNSDGYIENRLSKLDNFYTNEKDGNVAFLVDHYKKDKEKSLRYTKENRQKADFQENFDDSKFKEVLEEHNEAIEFYEKSLLIYPESSTLKNTLEEYREIGDDINSFYNDGEFAQLIAKIKADYYATVRMGEALMTDESAVQFLKKELVKDEDFKTFQRIIITDSKWHISKNGYGTPLYKYIHMQFAFKRDGECYFREVKVRREYNGSSYESMHVNMSTYTEQKILCENIFK